MKYNVLPQIRKDRPDKNGLVKINIFIYAAGVLKSKVTLDHSIDPAFWDVATRRVNPKYKNATLINSLITKKVDELNTKLLAEEVLTGGGVVDLPTVLNREKIRAKCFYEFAEEHITKKNYADETRRSYRVHIAKIKEYRKNLKLTEINYNFLLSYEAHLRDVLHNEPNTVWGNMKTINTITNAAIKSKYLSEDPFKTYKRPGFKQTKRTFLTVTEVKAVEDFYNKCTDDGLYLVSSYFLFMAFTGLRFSDAIRFRAEDHIIDGERIVIETQKTHKLTNIFINDKIKPLAEYVNANRLNISQQDFNRKLKLIAIATGIKKKLSSHVARHSFGALLVSLGASEKMAQGLLAHGNPSSTRVYFHLSNPALDETMKKFNTLN